MFPSSHAMLKKPVGAQDSPWCKNLYEQKRRNRKQQRKAFVLVQSSFL